MSHRLPPHTHTLTIRSCRDCCREGQQQHFDSTRHYRRDHHQLPASWKEKMILFPCFFFCVGPIRGAFVALRGTKTRRLKYHERMRKCFPVPPGTPREGMPCSMVLHTYSSELAHRQDQLYSFFCKEVLWLCAQSVRASSYRLTRSAPVCGVPATK